MFVIQEIHTTPKTSTTWQNGLKTSEFTQPEALIQMNSRITLGSC